MSNRKEKKWFNPIFNFDDDIQSLPKRSKPSIESTTKIDNLSNDENNFKIPIIKDHKNWMKNFDPVKIEDLAVHQKKITEVDEWLQSVSKSNQCHMLLLSGPVGCGKTTALKCLATKHNLKVTEWITPIDIEKFLDNGEYEFKEKQSTKFLDFIINAANFTSLLDNNSNKLVLVEDFPNTFLRKSNEFSDILQQYQARAKSPIVFICSEELSDNRNSSLSLFTPNLKTQFKIHHITFNSISVTGLKSALKRVSDIISKKFQYTYNTPTSELVECVVNSSAGDVRSAVLNLHFACLKGSSQNLEKSIFIEKEKPLKTARKKKTSSKFLSLGKDQTVNILHGVGRVLNPKLTKNEKGQDILTHSPSELVEQFLSQPSSVLNFLHENYLPHFSCMDHTNRAASLLSDADFMLGEWREKMCQEHGLYTAIAGLMLANKAPVSAWNPVRGPKSMKVQYPTPQDLPMLDQNYLYKDKVLVSDYQTFCKIIGNNNLKNENGVYDIE